MEIPDSMLNAAANVLGYKRNGSIRFIRRFGFFGRITGIWVKGFPGNTSRVDFLAMFCAMEKKDDLAAKIVSGAYSIGRSSKGDGYNVVFR